MRKSPGRPPKQEAERLAERIDIRITSAEKADFETASELAELSLSEWMRARLQTAARREIRKSAKQ